MLNVKSWKVDVKEDEQPKLVLNIKLFIYLTRLQNSLVVWTYNFIKCVSGRLRVQILLKLHFYFYYLILVLGPQNMGLVFREKKIE